MDKITKSILGEMDGIGQYGNPNIGLGTERPDISATLGFDTGGGRNSQITVEEFDEEIENFYRMKDGPNIYTSEGEPNRGGLLDHNKTL